MSEKNLVNILKNGKIEIDNPYSLEKFWYIDGSDLFENKMKEFYPPDVWFIGKNKTFEMELVKAIEKANELIIVCSFLIQETGITEAILKAEKKGVRVYILTASEHRLEKDQAKENETDNERIEDHKELLRILTKKCFIRTARHFHAKFILIDPKSENRIGYLSSANFTQNALSKNLEIGIKLNNNQIIDLFNTFCQSFWFEAEHESLSQESLRSVRKINENLIQKPRIEHIFGAKQELDFREALEKAIENTSGPIHICTYSIEQNTNFFDTLIKQLKKGRKLILYTRPRKNDLEPLTKLKEFGAQIRGHPLLHMKGLFIEDDKNPIGLIFTGNLTTESFDSSYDVGIYLSKEQSYIILSIMKSWNEIIPCTFFSKKNIKDLKTGNYLWWDKENVRVNIEENRIIYLGEINIENIKQKMDLDLLLNIPDSMKFKSKKFTFIWKVMKIENKSTK